MSLELAQVSSSYDLIRTTVHTSLVLYHMSELVSVCVCVAGGGVGERGECVCVVWCGVVCGVCVSVCH